MSMLKGRDLVLKIGNGAVPEVFSVIGAARMTDVAVENRPAEATTLDDEGYQRLEAAGGIQSMTVELEGYFRDSAAEAALQTAAFGRVARRYQLSFPNGDVYTAAFMVIAYRRGGVVDGMETFAVSLARSGYGDWS